MARQIRRILNAHPRCPLYHYTNATGLHGIITGSNIWATSAYHLNDSLEFRYALNMIRDQLQLRLTGEFASDAQRALLADLPTISTNFQVFVASFSEEEDLLSQWLSYGNGNNGYSLGLRFAHFRAALKNEFALVRCVYREDEHRELANWIIDAITSSMNPSAEDSTRVSMQALIAAAAMKHPGFAREREWRLVKVEPILFGDLKSVQFRAGRNGLVPYLRAPLWAHKQKLQPLSITIGPNTDPDAAELSVTTLLASVGLFGFFNSPVAIKRSATPFRP